MSTLIGIGLRGIVWLVAVLILAYGVDENKSRMEIKSQAGMFLLFLGTTGVLVFFLFGFKLL